MNPDDPTNVTEPAPPDPAAPHGGESAPQAAPDPARASMATRGWKTLAAAIAVSLVFAAGVVLGQVRAARKAAEPEPQHAEEVAQVWTCSMHPQIRKNEPGQCPICGMDLVLAEGAGAEPSDRPVRVELSPQARALARVATTKVVRTEPRTEVRLLGRVDYDETRLRMITPWTGGRVERLSVRVTGASVRKGQVVATLYSPEVYAAMRDLVVAAKQAEKLSGGMHGSTNLAAAAVSSAREKLRLVGVSEAEIEQIEKTRTAPKHVSIRSSFSGTVIERNVEEGDYVQAGTVLYHVADLSQVWIQMDAYESDLPHLQLGQTVLVEIESLGDEPLSGEIAFIDPIVDESTRTARVRVEVPNPDRDIRPGMFAEALVEADIGDKSSHLVIPATAALFTGRRSVVYVEAPEQPGVYELREVRLGPRAGPVYPVLSGLSEGESVVSRGAFAIDADLQLSGGRSMMTLDDDRSGQPGDSFPVTEVMLAQLHPVVDAYLEARRHLAADDFVAARGALETLATVVNDAEPFESRASREAWQPIASTLAGHARHAAAAKSEADVRTAFELTSVQLVELLRVFGNPIEEPLRVAHCPMAFDNRGAQWVQRDEVVANPYYGATMLRCGEFRATLLPGERLAAPTEAR